MEGVAHLLEKVCKIIDKQWLKLSLNSYKIKCKDLFLKTDKLELTN